MLGEEDGMYKQLFIKVLLLSFLGTGFYFAQKSTTPFTFANSDTSTSQSQLVDLKSEQIQAELKPQTTLLSASLIPQIEILASPRVDLNVPELQGTSGDGIVKMTLRATAYNSLTAQTDSTPFITSTGAKTRFGIVAVSRDMLDESLLPYGSLVKIKDLGHYKTGRTAGSYDDLLSDEVFIVEDTMHPRKRNQMDVWFPTYNQAKQWGVRQIEVEVVRLGRTGPRLDGTMMVKNKSDFSPLLSSR